jgi:DNA mismatch endonuclease, patch repair protein
MDRISKEHRSWNMSRIRSKNTAPEMIVRSLLHRLGYRFRIHRRDLPGRPDIVLPKLRVALFVHGCYWHRHKGCRLAYTPKSRTEFWQHKFEENVERDKRSIGALRELGWHVLVIWECQISNEEWLADRIGRFLERSERQGDASLRNRKNSSGSI